MKPQLTPELPWREKVPFLHTAGCGDKDSRFAELLRPSAPCPVSQASIQWGQVDLEKVLLT